ncbi:hypothetical protein LSH36_300g01030 [Paralvinella palmiformis]|uniref:Uncharacterized protein n=1 Tax=Paralvinella palmiformis TaxID=53620 RepID=A0AAD9JHR2_9ANNE|nr:hypothetical protein LSH36_300g01030 [Paralvinella palmiformis]
MASFMYLRLGSMSLTSENVEKVKLQENTVITEDMAKSSGHSVELGGGTPSKDADYVKPMNPLIWKTMITTLVLLYGSYSVLVHMCEKDGKLTFSSASYVFVVEFSKFGISIIMYLIETRGGEFQLPSLRLAMYYSVPGILYFINNNLSIHLQEEMDPATYQILSNLKILSTALLYRVIIKR